MITRRHLLAGLALPAMPFVRRALAQSPLRVGFIPILGAAPLHVADREGWAREQGLAFNFVQFESGPNMIQALASGTLDVYLAGVSPLVVAHAKGVGVKVVLSTAVEEMTVVAGVKLQSYFTSGRTAAAAFAAFKTEQGRPAKLATQPAGSVPNTTLQHWLWEMGKVAQGDVEIVPMGIDATQQALLTGAVDGATIREPAVTIVLQRLPQAKIVALGGEMFPNQPGTVLAVTQKLIDQSPDVVQKITAVGIRALDAMAREPARVVASIEAALGKGLVEQSVLQTALTSPASKFVSDPRLIVEATIKMQAYQVKLGTLDKEYPVDSLFDPSFYIRAKA